MEISFKIATNTDINLILTMMEEFYKLEHIPFNNQIATRCLEEIVSDDRLAKIWLICADEEPVGYVVLTFGYSIEFHGRDALVDELYIRENYRSQGIGTQTLEFVKTVCQSLGIAAVHLVVAYENKKAKSVYQKMGFVEHDRYIMTNWPIQQTHP